MQRVDVLGAVMAAKHDEPVTDESGAVREAVERVDGLRARPHLALCKAREWRRRTVQADGEPVSSTQRSEKTSLVSEPPNTAILLPIAVAEWKLQSDERTHGIDAPVPSWLRSIILRLKAGPGELLCGRVRAVTSS